MQESEFVVSEELLLDHYVLTVVIFISNFILGAHIFLFLLLILFFSYKKFLMVLAGGNKIALWTTALYIIFILDFVNLRLV